MIGRAKLTAFVAGLALMSYLPGVAQAEAPGYSAAGLYNLANSYARAGKPGMAVLNYERAGLLAPDDPDIEANLRFVRRSSHLPSEPSNWFERSVSVADPTLVSWAGVIGLLIAGASVVAERSYPRHRRMRRAGMVLGIALVGLTVCNGAVLWPKLHEAIVITSATPVRVSPVPMGDPLFVLPEAESVRMTMEHEGFVLIQTREGRTGWVARANLAPVVPRSGPPLPTG